MPNTTLILIKKVAHEKWNELLNWCKINKVNINDLDMDEAEFADEIRLMIN